MSERSIQEELRGIAAGFEGDPNSAEVWSRWRALWSKATERIDHSKAAVDDVLMILHTGWVAKMSAGCYREAANLVHPYLQHADFERADKDLRVALTCDLAESWLQAGEQDEAVAIYASLLRSSDRLSVRHAAARIRNALGYYCAHQPGAEAVPSVLAELVESVVRQLRRRATTQTQRGARSDYAQLCSLLESAFPPEDREQLRSEREGATGKPLYRPDP